MPEHVVHALEPVEVDEQERDSGPAAPRPGECRGHLLDEERSAPETGQTIVRGVVFEPLLEPLALGDVLERSEEGGHGPVGVAERDRTHAHPTGRAIGQRDAELARRRAFAPSRILRRVALLLAQALEVVVRDDRRPTASQRLEVRQAGEARERGIHERATIFEIHLEDADRALPDERAPAGLAIEDGLVDRAHDRALHVGMIEQVPHHERHVVPTVVLVVHAHAHFDVDARRDAAARERVDHDGEIVLVHPFRDADAQVVEPGEPGVRAEAPEHDPRADVGAEDRDCVGQRADDIRVANVERLGVGAVAFRRGERRNPCHRACIDIGGAQPYSVTAMTTNFASPQDLLGAVGADLGVTDWVTITQDQIDKFADATLDNQWIHVDTERAKAGPFGTPIAHGYLTMSLAAHFLSELVHVSNISMGINYGVDKVRFPAPVPVNSRVHAKGELLEAKEVPGGVQATVRLTMEREGGDKPVAIVDAISRYLA